MKFCSKCNSELSIENFGKCKSKKDGLQDWCKSCRSLYQKQSLKYKFYQQKYHKENRLENRDKLIEKARLYRQTHQNKIKEYYQRTKIEHSKNSKEYRTKNKEKLAEYSKLYRIAHKEELKEIRQKNKERTNEKAKLYRLVNLSKIKEHNQRPEIKFRRNQIESMRLKNDINFRLKKLLSKRIRNALINNSKKLRTVQLLGCSINELKSYLQQTAINNGYKDFNINSYSSNEYHIDHIAPCSMFNLACGYHQKLCFNWSNLQILDAKTNLIKNARILNKD